jgi:DNA-binding NtrC family response regulator
MTASPLHGGSPAMVALRGAIECLAARDVGVLIHGERGTGKELTARALHEHGPRRHRRFVAADCGALPDGGDGALDRALDDLFDEAAGGTLLLDEIDALPAPAQARLVRLLHERGHDVRVIAASSADLRAAARAGRFRDDLISRLEVVTLAIPALRDRTDDIVALVRHFVRVHGDGRACELSPAAHDALCAYAWPGNVRELENAVQHALALYGGERLELGALPATIRAAATRAATDHGDDGDDAIDQVPIAEARRRLVTDFERGYLERLLQRVGGNMSEASRRSGLDRANLRRLMHRHGLDATRFRAG